MTNMLIIDGNSILNRAYYGSRPLSTRSGMPTNAISVFINILLRHIETIEPSLGAVAFDLPEPTFRHIEYPEYKAGRRAMPDDLALQLPYAKKCAKLLGLPVIELSGYEADDLLGTLAARAAEDGKITCYILTGDRDSLQLIDQNTSVLLAGNSETAVIDRERFIADYGIDPSLFVEIKALTGDKSDNIPGVAGIGEKTALKLVSAYGSLDDIYSKLDSLTVSKSIRQKLADGEESARLSRQLSLIDRNVPLPGGSKPPAISAPDREGLLELFTELEFAALIRRMGLSAEIRRVDYERIPKSKVTSLPAGRYTIDFTPADDAAPLDLLSDGAVPNERKDDTLGTLRIVCDENAFICHDIDKQTLADFFKDTSYNICTYDSKKLLSCLLPLGIDDADISFDITLAAYVLNSSDNSYDLRRLSSSYLSEVYDPENSDDTSICHRLRPVLEELLTGEQSELYYDIELPLARVLCEMELAGFKVNRAGLLAYSEKLGQKAKDIEESIYRRAGVEFNVNSPKQLGEVLFDKMGLPAAKKTKSGYSTSAEVLEKLLGVDPIISEILEFRQVMKLKSTYTDGLVSVADREGKIHTTFNQTVTATGRLSSTEPNLQNIPIRHPQGRELRRFFIAGKPDRILIDADYSQIELRILAHMSGDETMINAFINGDDIHTITASQVFGIPINLVTPELRGRAKAVNFGIIYGIGDFSLAADIGVSKYQAGEYIKSYFEKYPGVDEYMNRTVADAKEKGYVTTLLGRRRYIPELSSPKAALRAFGERVAMNSPIQGTAADIIKVAMINTAKALSDAKIPAQMILQVHDELIVESDSSCADEAQAILKREMENAYPLSVPLTVDVSMGETWFK